MPQFELKLECEIKYIYFFKGKDNNKEESEELDIDDIENKKKGFLKKNFIIITTDEKVIIKNLGIRKKSNSEVSKYIFYNTIVPKLIVGECKFSKVYILGLIKEIIRQDINMALLRKDVGNIKSYANTTSLAAQISQKYGSGIHFLIPNLRGVGAGKGKHFCTLEEFKKNNMSVNDIDYDGFLKELEYFIKPVVAKNIFDFGGAS
jgi:hypothetical protein